MTIPNSVTYIGKSAFFGCSGLKDVIFNAENCTSCGTYDDPAFPPTIENLTFGDTIKTIPSYAFKGCPDLTSVTIPNSVTSIGSDAFSGCSGLKDVIFNAENCTSCGTSADPAFPSTIETLTFGETVKTIPSYAFKGCSGLTSVTIPNYLTSIADGTFDGCSGLTSVEIPTSVTSIGSYAFDGCSSLTSVSIPNSVTSIGENAFVGCSSLASVKSLCKEAPEMNINSFDGLYDKTEAIVPDNCLNNYVVSQLGLSSRTCEQKVEFWQLPLTMTCLIIE